MTVVVRHSITPLNGAGTWHHVRVIYICISSGNDRATFPIMISITAWKPQDLVWREGRMPRSDDAFYSKSDEGRDVLRSAAETHGTDNCRSMLTSQRELIVRVPMAVVVDTIRRRSPLGSHYTRWDYVQGRNIQMLTHAQENDIPSLRPLIRLCGVFLPLQDSLQW